MAPVTPRPVTPFVLPLTVRTVGGDVDLAVELPGPQPLSTVLPDVVAAAALPAGTVLHLGAGPAEGSWTLGRPPLLAGSVLSADPVDRPPDTAPVNLSCVAGPDTGRWVGLGTEPVVVGRDPTCDLTLDDPELSRRHAVISSRPDGLRVTDLRSANGVLVDGQRGDDGDDGQLVPFGALVRLGGSMLRAGLDPEPTLLLTPDGRGRLAVARPARVAPPFHRRVRPAAGPAPVRTTRPIPLLAAVVAAVAGAAVAALTGLWTFLLLAALGPVMMLAGAVSDRVGGRRSHRRLAREYREALLAEAEELGEAVAADRSDAWDRYPDAATLLRRVRGSGSRLWERRPADPDFLRLSFGVGSRLARLESSAVPMVDEAPITVDLAGVGVLGLAGDHRPLLRHLIAQLLALHAPSDLALTVLSDDPELLRVRDVPHTAMCGQLGICPDEAGAAAAVADLLRRSDPGVTVVLLDDSLRWRRLPEVRELLAATAHGVAPEAALRDGPATAVPVRGRSGLIAICTAASVEALPVECTAIAVVRAGRVRIAAGSEVLDAEPAGVSPRYLEALCRALMPLIDPDTTGGGLPHELAFCSLLAGRDIGTTLAEQWQRPTASAVLGAGHAGPVVVDLERDGPHLLVAGTTGSGKSELLQTLLAGLACAAPPTRTTFLLVDYKGGSAFGRLTRLPHTTALVTDLDPALATRALTSLRAEVRRREACIAAAGAVDLADLRRRRPDLAPPSLVIVVDEFATLGAELPEFLTGLLDVAQRGRSLGLHLVLATQRPAGVLSPAIRANIGLRVCLRVTDDADSVDVVDTVAAARLRADTPGRAILRFERGRSLEFQVARIGVRGNRRPVVRRRPDHAGPGRSGPDTAAQRDPGGRTDLDELVAAARAAAQNLSTPAPPWLPPLPEVFRPDDPAPDPATDRSTDGPELLLGLVDRPAEQRQFGWSGPTGSLMVLGAPGSGRSTALRRLGWVTAASGGQVATIDAGGGLRELADWPAGLAYLDAADPSLIQRLVQRVQEEVRRRSGVAGFPVLLLVDGWDAVSGALDQLDYGATVSKIADLAGRGPAVGIRVAIGGDLRLRHHRIASSFTTVVRLGVDGRDERVEAPPGRGRLGSDEIQLARSGVGPPPAPPGGAREWPGRPDLVVRALPAAVDLRSLPAARPDAVPLGLGGDAGLPVGVDLAGRGGGLLVAGPRRSGVSNTLAVLASGAAVAGLRVVRGCIHQADPLPGVEDVDLRSGGGRLRELLVEHVGAILLVADDVHAWPDDAGALLERFLAVAGPGQHLAVGVRLDRALRCAGGPVRELAALRTGVLLQADTADGALLDAALPRPRGRPPVGRGHLVLGGCAVPVQVARW